MARTTTEGHRIFAAQRVAHELSKRASTEHNAVVGISRDELRALAEQLSDVASIAERHHLAAATAGSIAPDAFEPPPAE